MGTTWRDMSIAVRRLRADRGFTAVALATLALGIGANTTIFTLVDAVLLRNLPVKNPRELIAIGDPARTSSFSFSRSLKSCFGNFRLRYFP